MSKAVQALLAQLPAVHALADRAREHSRAPRWALVEAARRQVATRRAAILAGETQDAALDAAEVATLAGSLARPSLRRVVNATGVVLHTNLGRAPLPTAALDAIAETAAGYSNLEYDLAAGQRGSRHDHLRELLRQLTGAEDAIVVNNNAAATVLGLAALAAGRGVVVSRGEQIEIGGSFRLPEILALSGCRMIEVGTTNKTHLADYRDAAAAEGTALLLKVHRSNFAIVGFTSEVSAAELVALAGELASEGSGATRPRPSVMLDLGSGAFLSAELQRAAGLPVEPTVAEAVASGADLVSFSGDKLLGGPQAGILVGRAAAVARARKHPLMRVLRPDKLTIAALEATLACYRDGRLNDVPALYALRRHPDAIRVNAERALTMATAATADRELGLELIACTSTVGGGAMPTAALPSWAIAVHHPHKGATELEAHFRTLRPPLLPILGRIQDDVLLLDLRTVADDELQALVDALVALAA